MISQKNLEKLTGTHDIVMKAIMYPRIHILKNVLETILGKKIDKIKYLCGELPVAQFIRKGNRLDAYVTDMKSYFDIEVSRSFDKYISWRNYAFASQVYMSTIKQGESYKNYKRTYLINIISGSKQKIPIRIENHLDQGYNKMTNMITEYRVSIDYFVNLYYNNGNLEEILKYRYLIMLGLTLKELKIFNERYGR